MDKQDKYKAPALEKGLDILEFLASQTSPQSQGEIAQGLLKSPNEIYRMLAALEARGYIHRDSVSTKYALTLKLYYLSHRHSIIDRLRSAAVQPMRKMSAAIKQPCHLGVLFNDKVLVIAYSKSPSPIAVMIEEGNLYDVSITASGKILLSQSNDETKRQILDRDTHYQELTSIQQQKFENEINQIKSQGHIIMPSSYAQGIVNFSVPIGTENSGIVACLTVSKLQTLLNKDEPENNVVIENLLICKMEIETTLGLN